MEDFFKDRKLIQLCEKGHKNVSFIAEYGFEPKLCGCNAM